MGMKLRKIICTLAGLVAMAAVVGYSAPVLADVYETWSGPITIKLTITDQNSAGKLVKTTQYDTGTVVLYAGIDGPVAGPNGNYLEVLDSTQALIVAIKGLTIVSTSMTNTKSAKIMGVGAGEFLQGGSPVGPAYLTLTGKVALDGSGNPTLITATVAMGGGSSNGSNYIWSCKPKVVLQRLVKD
jgi:hypothetical protein